MNQETSTHKIMSMESDKRERVLNAAMAEFCKGYKHASTDVIVREAGISKGLLFHYFGTKKDLLLFLLQYAMEVILSEFFCLINFEQHDFLERLWQIILVKMDLSYKYPAIFDFLVAVYLDKEDELNEVNIELNSQYREAWELSTSKLFSDIDTTLFKDGIDASKAMNIIKWTFQGYSESLLSEDKTVKDYQTAYEAVLQEVKEYMDILRNIFYR